MKAHENPFRSERIDALPYLSGGESLDEIEARFHALGRCAAIVGPHGSGKTTLLEALKPRLARFDVRFVDGAGLLGPFGFLRLLASRKGGGLLVTAHRSLLVIPTLFICRPSLELGARLAERLSPGIDRAHLSRIFSRHSGNMHEVWRSLYHDPG